MELRRLQASFGRLDGEELTFSPGLNVIEAPNEGGKSTWAAFLRAMLYGVSTSERAKNGRLPDRLRYQPWSGAPMAGSMDLVWQEKEVTLRRLSPGGGRPMGEAEAVFTGTEERVPELRSGVPGELLLGVTEPVFRRSAFISGSELALDANAELEKRITRLVTSGEERASWSEADERLRRWQRKRRWRSGGSLPEAEARRRELQQKLRRIEEENRRLSELREEEERLLARKAALQLELRLHLRDERRAELARRAASEEAYAEACRTLAEAERRRDGLTARAAGLSPEKIQTLRAAAVRLEEAKRDRDAAASEYAEVKEALDSLPPAEAQPNPKKTPVLVLFLLGLLALLGGFAGGMGLYTATVGLCYGLISLGIVLLLIAALLLSSGRKAVRAMEAERAHEKELREQAEETAGRHLAACEEETALCEKALAEALTALGAAADAEPEETARDAEALLGQLRDARLLAESAAGVKERLRTEPLPPPEPIPEDELPGEPKVKKEAAEDYLRRTEERLRELRRELDRGEGFFDLLGDPLVLASQEAKLTEDIQRLQEEYDALELAQEALREANSQLQTLFSPLISRRAAELLGRMTDRAYAGVYFDREMHFSAQRSGDLNARALDYLSEGTRNQLYLAVRLAICELVLSGEACPLILDDALAAFDDRRARDTLRLLLELSRDRQILLFTCQSRENRLLAELRREA